MTTPDTCGPPTESDNPGGSLPTFAAGYFLPKTCTSDVVVGWGCTYDNTGERGAADDRPARHRRRDPSGRLWALSGESRGGRTHSRLGDGLAGGPRRGRRHRLVARAARPDLPPYADVRAGHWSGPVR